MGREALEAGREAHVRHARRAHLLKDSAERGQMQRLSEPEVGASIGRLVRCSVWPFLVINFNLDSFSTPTSLDTFLKHLPFEIITNEIHFTSRVVCRV